MIPEYRHAFGCEQLASIGPTGCSVRPAHLGEPPPACQDLHAGSMVEGGRDLGARSDLFTQLQRRRRDVGLANRGLVGSEAQTAGQRDGDNRQMDQLPPAASAETAFYCAECRKPVAQPLVCKDCLGVICRDCGTPLERVDDLGIG